MRFTLSDVWGFCEPMVWGWGRLRTTSIWLTRPVTLGASVAPSVRWVEDSMNPSKLFSVRHVGSVL